MAEGNETKVISHFPENMNINRRLEAHTGQALFSPEDPKKSWAFAEEILVGVGEESTN